jgi:hypothetical protein
MTTKPRALRPSGSVVLFTRGFQSRPPVSGSSMPMSHGDDQNAARFDSVDEAVWKAPASDLWL